MKHENILSYHRMMNQSVIYKGKALLKMYPTWNKNEMKEIIRFGKKFDKTYNLFFGIIE
jgi:hypothetical protein